MKKLFACILFLVFIVLHTGCMTPLTSAARKGDNNTVKELLDKGADVNEDSYGGSVLTHAIGEGHLDTVKLLLDRGADVGRGADVKRAGRSSWTPLSHAAYLGHAEIAKLLIERGADVNKDSPLAYAVFNGHIKIAKLLIEKGADIDEAMAELKDASRSSTLITLLENLRKQQQPSSQPVTTVSKSSPGVSPLVKSDVDELPAIKAKPNKNSYAIVIGIENYRQKLPKADFATGDARLVTEYLTKALGYPEENVITLMNEQVTKSDFEKYLEEWLPKNFDKNGSLLFYYSGHGAPNPRTGDAFLVPYDGDPNFIEKTGYPLKKLYENLSMLQAKEVIVVLDSCFSGAGGRSVLAEGSRPLVMNMPIALASAKNMIIMAASSGSEISSSYKDKGHGLFTYFLLKGIKGEADANEDGRINIEELYQYLKPQVQKTARRLYNNEQTPQLIAPSPAMKGIVLQK